jgi:molybdopterin synthase catalytic subunit
VTETPLDVETTAAAVRSPAHGAVVIFEGIVREENLGRRVSFLEYEAFVPMAETEMERIAQEAEARWGPLSVAIAHRTGRLEIGELSLVVAVASPHRAEAFEGCRYIVDQVKERAPIWKKEVWEGGGEWIGLAQGAAS